MMLEVTEEAAAVLRRSLELGGVDPGRGGVRLRPARALGGGASVQVELAEGPAPGELTFEAAGLRLFLDPALTGSVVDVEQPHERIIVRDGPL
jgi:hypothetical protein